MTTFLVFINIPDGRYSFIPWKGDFLPPPAKEGGDRTGGERDENHCRPGDRALRDAGRRGCDSPDFQTEKPEKAPEGSERSFVGEPWMVHDYPFGHLTSPLPAKRRRIFPLALSTSPS